MIEPGRTLGPVELHVTTEVVAAYADVARDHNPIHFHDDAARAVGLPAPSAHGMISGAVLSRLLTGAFGERWLRGGAMSIKFVRPVSVGSVIRARATVRSVEPTVLDVRVDDANAEAVIVGRATVRNVANELISDSTLTSVSSTVPTTEADEGVR